MKNRNSKETIAEKLSEPRLSKIYKTSKGTILNIKKEKEKYLNTLKADKSNESLEVTDENRKIRMI